METVIAIGVIALLITGFVAVFAPAVQGIRRSISSEEANRLTSTLEQELVTLRAGQQPTTATSGFAKAFDWILNSNDDEFALIIYQYRGDLDVPLRTDDGTHEPRTDVGVPGEDYVTVSMVRRVDDPRLFEDLDALEGRPLVVRCTQLVYDAAGALESGTAGIITDPKDPGDPVTAPDDYPDAVLAFSADFFSLPSRSPEYFQGEAFSDYFATRMNRPMFTRNLAIRR